MAITSKSETGKEKWWEWAQENRSSRLDYVRKAVWHKGHFSGEYPHGVMMGVQRTYWYTKSFLETEGQPWVIRRARALETFLENMPICMVDQSWIVGYSAERPNMLNIHAEASFLLNDDLYYDRAGYIEPEDRQWMRKALDYWQGKDMTTIAERYLPPQDATFCKLGVGMLGHTHLSGFTTSVIDYDYMLEHGLNGIIKKIEERLLQELTELSSGQADPNRQQMWERVPRIDQYRAMLISARAMIKWADRYSRLATTIAENFETDSKRKADLVRIAEICAKVPANPPEHYWEAVQAVWFVTVVSRHMERSHTGFAMRLDQVFWPYYEKDVIIDKTMKREDAVDIIGEFRLRMWENAKTNNRIYREAQPSEADLPVVTIGGVKADGTDACNELTESVCESLRLTRHNNPSVVFRYHPNTSVAALREVFECVRHGLGYPTFEHEAHSIAVLTGHYGCTIEEARSWGNSVCMSPVPTKGKATMADRYAGGVLFGGAILNLAMHDGYEPSVGIQVGPHTGDPNTWTSYDQLLDAFRQQSAYVCGLSSRVMNITRYVQSQYFQATFQDCLFERVVETGTNCFDPRNGEKPIPWTDSICSGDVGDSLYVIKKLVFDDKKYKMSELMEAVDSEWEGYEKMRQECVMLPKWGNDIDDVDKCMAEYINIFGQESMKQVTWGGGNWMPLYQNAAGYVAMATRQAAMPNGRRRNDPFYDGGIGPGAGLDRKGPTAVLRSFAKLDHVGVVKQCQLNQRLMPDQMAGDKGFQLWFNYMKTWYDLGIPHVQFNVVDNETLRAAQREPEKYSELMVRVGGFSAIFVALEKTVQDTIICRTVQEL